MSHNPPNVDPPTREEIREKGAAHFMNLSEEEIDDIQTLVEGTLPAYERLDELPVSRPRSPYTDRDPGYQPTAAEDPLNAFVTKCHVEGAEEGPLAGVEVGLKDNVALAGVEMTCGSRIFEGYVPNRDATVARRLLDAGATITGKLNMEDMAFSGSGELSATGEVVNPRDDDHIAGGSSSGSAAAVVADEVDVAIGGDQGGSIRIPAAWSGCVGHKPTHTLVPYTGVVGLGHTFDHVGPIATSVTDCARVLDAVAGEDPDDPRQGAVPTDDYEAALGADPADLTVGVLEEGFDHEESEREVDARVREALDALEEAGATVRDVSVPMHLDGLPLWNAIATEEFAALVRDEGVGKYAGGYYDEQFAKAFGDARRARADDYLFTVKLTLVLGQYLADEYASRYYAKAQNLRRDLAGAYDEALADVDVLAMPTTPQTAHERRDDLSRVELVDRALNMLANTAPFDVSGHPAASVPAGEVDGLPVGLMFVGERFDDAAVLRAADAFEREVGWEL